MTLWSVAFIALALSLDAFAVSISCGIKLQKLMLKKFIKISLYFGSFQTFMPLLGWLAGSSMKGFFEPFSKWLAFSVFAFLGIKTLNDVRKRNAFSVCEYCTCDNFSCLFGLAVATSIDAFLVGLVFAVYSVPLAVSVVMIGVITFGMSMIGCFIGNKANALMGKRAGIVAGFILLALAIKSLVE